MFFFFLFFFLLYQTSLPPPLSPCIIIFCQLLLLFFSLQPPFVTFGFLSVSERWSDSHTFLSYFYLKVLTFFTLFYSFDIFIYGSPPKKRPLQVQLLQHNTKYTTIQYICFKVFIYVLISDETFPVIKKAPLHIVTDKSINWAAATDDQGSHARTRLSFIGRRVDSITNPPTAMNVNWEPVLVEDYFLWGFSRR